MIINQTGGGTQPTGTTQITSNGTHNVAGYEFADVQVPTTAPAHYVEKANDGTGKLINGGSSVIDLTGITEIDNYVLYYAYYNNTGITSFPDFSNVTKIGDHSLYYCFNNALNATGAVNLSGITDLYFGIQNSGLVSTFKGTKITSLDLSNLEQIDQYTLSHMCEDCPDLTDADLRKLKYVAASGTTSCDAFNYTFNNCPSLVNVHLESLRFLKKTGTYTFANCSSLQTNPFTGLRFMNGSGGYMFDGCAAMTDGTFPKLEFLRGETFDCYFNMTYRDCPNLTKLDFPAFTNCSRNGSNYALNNLFGNNGVENLHDIHFPMFITSFSSALTANSFRKATSNPSLTIHFRMDAQTEVSAVTGYSSNFGASAVVFDLVGTITANGVNYIREGSLNENGYIVWHKNTSNITVNGTVLTFDQTGVSLNSNNSDFCDVLFYKWTDGTTTYYTDTLNPQIGDFIYTSNRITTKSTTLSITAIDNEFVYTADSAEPAVNDTAYSDASLSTVAGTITAIA